MFRQKRTGADPDQPVPECSETGGGVDPDVPNPDGRLGHSEDHACGGTVLDPQHGVGVAAQRLQLLPCHQVPHFGGAVCSTGVQRNNANNSPTLQGQNTACSCSGQEK